MNEEYRRLISQTFCENSIRSVMMIDDDFISYKKCIDTINKGGELTESQKFGSEKAANMSLFFQNKKLICDVSDGSDNFCPEKIRKSDLVLLDFELEKSDPTKSIELLNKLKNTIHMNLVVVYTNNDLNDVWLKVAASLMGSSCLENSPDVDGFDDFWDAKTEDGAVDPDEIEIVSGADLSDYILRNKPNRGTISSLIREMGGDNRKYLTPFFRRLCKEKISSYEVIEKDADEKKEVEGRYEGGKWLKIGNVFIAFYSKSPDQDDSEGIWNALESSLHDWSPNYFRLITSEVQNRIENGGIVLDKYLDKDYFAQAAWLWEILKCKDPEGRILAIKNLLSNNNENFKENIVFHSDVIDFTNALVDSVSQDESVLKIKNDKDGLLYSAKKVSETLNIRSGTLPEDIAHALNRSLSTKNIDSKNIKTGTLLTSATTNKWYLCVSPVCDTVPNQHTNQLAKRLTPFRLLKFLILEEINIRSALDKAARGKYLFLEDRKSLQVPDVIEIDYAVVHDHDENHDNGGQFTVSFLEKHEGNVIQKEDMLYAVTQLKDAYSARFQAIASNHTGRVGVDFVNLSVEEKTE